MEYCNVIIMVVFIGRIIVIIFLVKFLLVIIIIYCEMYEVNVLLIKEVRKLEQVNYNSVLFCNKTFGDQILFVFVVMIFLLCFI